MAAHWPKLGQLTAIPSAALSITVCSQKRLAAKSKSLAASDKASFRNFTYKSPATDARRSSRRLIGLGHCAGASFNTTEEDVIMRKLFWQAMPVRATTFNYLKSKETNWAIWKVRSKNSKKKNSRGSNKIKAFANNNTKTTKDNCLLNGPNVF